MSKVAMNSVTSRRLKGNLQNMDGTAAQRNVDIKEKMNLETSKRQEEDELKIQEA